jgi:neutral ceramidase
MNALFLIALALVDGSAAKPGPWQAGVAKVAITPRESTWMAGYASRTKPSEGKIHDLWAKALAIVDPDGHRGVLITLDICGIPAEVSNAIRDNAKARFNLERDQIVLACSHTHSGPVVGKNLIGMYPMDAEQRRRVEEWTAALIKSMGDLIASAVDDMEPAIFSWSNARVDFAVNRRTNKEQEVPDLRKNLSLQGPVDHDVPILKIETDAGLMAVVCGYACHCTVLSDNKFSGDYAGFAQLGIEAAHPGTMALFVAGCGADQNPIPRKSVELAETYGSQLAKAVDDALAGSLRLVDGSFATAYEEIPLAFAKLPTKAELEIEAKSTEFARANRARTLLATLEKKGALDLTYPYPVQVWRLGGLTWIFLGGEVVVDYSLRIKRNLGSSQTWVSAYCNDVMAYIPSVRVLKEGGYEGGGAMVYYGLPSPWAESVESEIVAAVGRLVETVKAAP